MFGTWPSLGIAYALSWVIVIAALFIVPRNRKPGSATAWLMLIVLLPFLGLVLFLLIGSPKLSRRRRAQQRALDKLIAARVDEAQEDSELAPYFGSGLPYAHKPVIALNEALGGMPACAGNTVELIPGYNDAIAAMAAAIDSANRFVHVEFYIMALDEATEPFIAALERASSRGVPVRLLVDHWASHSFPRRREMCRRLSDAGIDWRWSLPLRPLSNSWNRPDLRNHRKLVVVDGRCAFTGSINMIDASYHRARNLKSSMRYVETVSRVQGPVVLEINAVFLTDWFSEGGTPFDTTQPTERELLPTWSGEALCQIVPSGPGYDNDNNLKMFTSLFHASRGRICITTPYFVPDESLMIAITSAAQRGVDVVMITAGVSNQIVVQHAQQSYYEELLTAGVRIFLLNAPELLHAKHVSVDNDVAVIGSSNLDMRSFTLNMEITLVAYDAGVVNDLRSTENAFLERARELTLDAWRAQPWPGKLFNNLARLSAALQ